MKTLWNIKPVAALLIAVLALAAPSCVAADELYFDPALIGDWTLVEASGKPVSSFDADSYVFYDNGDGYYGYYADDGAWITEQFQWEDDGRGRLFIYYRNTYMPNVDCYYRYDNGYLLFSVDPYFEYYNVYAPTR